MIVYRSKMHAALARNFLCCLEPNGLRCCSSTCQTRANTWSGTMDGTVTGAVVDVEHWKKRKENREITGWLSKVILYT